MKTLRGPMHCWHFEGYNGLSKLCHKNNSLAIRTVFWHFEGINNKVTDKNIIHPKE